MSLLDQFSPDPNAINRRGVVVSRPDFRESPVSPLPEALPTSYLDKAVVRVAVLRARELFAQGYSADEAARLACPGSWSQWRSVVRMHLERAHET
jgi:hypothetical protein